MSFRGNLLCSFQGSHTLFLVGEVADDSSMEVVKKINDLGSSNGVPLVKKVCIVRSGTV